jgi:hypothetical protein
MRHVGRGGEYLRVADPDWDDPLDGAYARERGGRWNPPDSFPVVYLCLTVDVARANVYRLLAGLPYGPEDLDPDAAPVLVTTSVREDRFVDAVGAPGLASLGLPRTYPTDNRGRPVSHGRCQAVGQRAWDAGEPGIACRSAAKVARKGGEELAWFQRRRRLRAKTVAEFERWFWEV